MTLIDAQNLSISRGGWLIIKGLSFSVQAREILVIQGANGAGKSSLLRTLAGITDPLAGKIQSKEGLNLCYLGHETGLSESLPILDSLTQQSQLLIEEENFDHESNAFLALESFGLAEYQDTPPQHLSAGQNRRAALARLLLRPTDLWLIDEPHTHLDEEGQAILWHHVDVQREQGGGVVLTSHQEVPLKGATMLRLS